MCNASNFTMGAILGQRKEGKPYVIYYASKLLDDCVEVFMDGFSVYGTNFSHCLDNLSKVLDRCIEHGLVLNWEKCRFMA